MPVLLPTAQALGMDPVHFGVVAVVNIMLGLITPPYGLLLFVMVQIAEVPLRDLVRDTLPFLFVMIGALAADHARAGPGAVPAAGVRIPLGLVTPASCGRHAGSAWAIVVNAARRAWPGDPCGRRT